MYSVCAMSFLVWYYSGEEENRKKSLVDIPNRELLTGLAVTAVTALAIECITRCVYIFIWTIDISNASGRIVAVWWPHMNIFLLATCVNICGHIYTYYRQCIKLRKKHRTLSDKLWEIHSSEVHAILSIALISFGLVYTGLPAVILVFVYPTQMIAILAFVLSFFFATTISSAILFKYFMQFLNSDNRSLSDSKLHQVEINMPRAEQNNKKVVRCSHKWLILQLNKIKQRLILWMNKIMKCLVHVCFYKKKKSPIICLNKVKKWLINGMNKIMKCMICCLNKRKKCKVAAFLLTFIPFLIFILYIHAIISVLLYYLIIGKGSVISTGPTFIISLLPPVFLSSVSWIAKRYWLNNDSDVSSQETS